MATAAARLPPVHVDEDEKLFTITADVPGLSAKDIKVRHHQHNRLEAEAATCGVVRPVYHQKAALVLFKQWHAAELQ